VCRGMGESLAFTKDVLLRTLELLTAVPAGSVQEEEMREIRTRVQMAQNAIIQNERKIWLRTKEGKEMIGEFGVASTKLLGAVERLQRQRAPDAALLKDLKAALGEVEFHAKRVNEESRRRSMAVT